MAAMPIRAINHLAFITEDLEKTIRFYRDLLGMKLFAGVGHDGYRHYFLRFGDNQVAFFEYEGASPMEKKFPGTRTTKPLGFDHVSFTVDSCEDLFAFKDRLEAAGVEVHGAVDHGTIWSIYFYDPNGIPLELSWELLEVTRPPAVSEEVPMPIVAEGSDPKPGMWPEATRRTPPEQWVAKAGNGHVMREAFLSEGSAVLTEESAKILARAAKP
jgi:catechol 2,3-dioxygenase-like lactoylglutathione lyase family enzyme